MLEFIQILKQRYQAVIAALPANHANFADFSLRCEQLLYAEAFIRKGQLIDQHKTFPLQIAVIGPTQAGKSTLVNLLLGQPLAGVSPLAGYTMHAQGFAHDIQLQEATPLQQYFGRFQQLLPEQLSATRYDCYALADANAVPAPTLLPSCIIWDTPDFDSIDAHDYQEGLIRTLALADIIVLVVSKEKYADQSVWDMMAKIEPFHQPTLICVNKLSEGHEQVVLSSLAEKWLQVRQDAFPAVVPLFYSKVDGQPRWPEQFNEIFFKLHKAIALKKHAYFQQQLLQKHWQSWLEPVYEELQARRQWQLLIEKSLQQALAEYRRDYLDHPHHYQTFQNALIELLNLLEIPGIANVIGKARRVMTWPVRKLFQLGTQSYSGVTQETAILRQIGEHVVIQIADHVWEKSEVESSNRLWWKEIGSLLRVHKGEVLQRFSTAVQRYDQTFKQDIEATAHRLYQQLLQQPAILNTLRATRVTTDATALALAIKTGGLGLHDLIVTPAMLSITSLLAESAVGGYMHRLEAELKAHQLDTVANQLFNDVLQQQLLQLLDRMSDDKRFKISPEQLQQAEQALQAKKHGLRIL